MAKITLAKIKAYLKLVEDLKALKKKEVEARRALVGEITDSEISGTYKKEFPWGTLVAKINTYLKVDKDLLEGIEHKLSEAELAAVVYKPEIKRREFKLLDKKSILRKAVTETPGMPGFEFRPPKKKGKR